MRILSWFLNVYPLLHDTNQKELLCILLVTAVLHRLVQCIRSRDKSNERDLEQHTTVS